MLTRKLRNVEIVDEYQNEPNYAGEVAIYADCPFCDNQVVFYVRNNRYHNNKCHGCGAHFTDEEAYFPEPAYAYLFE